MLTACGVICLLFGLLGLVGQLISTLNFPLAQELGLQERPEESDPLYARLELNTARWDLAVIWTLPLAGLLMILGHGWWPVMALIAGSIHLDTAGRETAKVLGLRHGGVRVGSAKEARLGLIFFGAMALISLWAIGLALLFLLPS